MKTPFLLTVLFSLVAQLAHTQTLNLFNVTDDATSLTEYYNGQAFIFAQDRWNGVYDLGVTGTTSGGSSLPNPGRESSGSGSFFADHSFGTSSWNLSGWAQGSIDAGLGNTGTTFPTIAQTTILGGGFSFYVDTPFTISLTSMLTDSYVGAGPENPFNAVDNRASVRLYAEIIDGVLVNQYLANWQSNASSGGNYTGSFSSGVFRLELYAGSVLSSNIPDDFGTQYSSYDAQLSIGAVPEPGSALLLGVASLYPLLRRRRQLQRRTRN
jgi:hypothetical protein